MSNNVSINTINFLQWKQFQACLIPSQGEPTDQKDQRNDCTTNPPHPRDSFPARDAKCHRCSKMGHFAAVYLTKPLNTKEEEATQTEPMQSTSILDFFLDTVEDLQNSKYWIALNLVNGYAIPFKHDTGAEITAIIKQIWNRLDHQI